jgi:hypothetical protein
MCFKGKEDLNVLSMCIQCVSNVFPMLIQDIIKLLELTFIIFQCVSNVYPMCFQCEFKILLSS